MLFQDDAICWNIEIIPSSAKVSLIVALLLATLVIFSSGLIINASNLSWNHQPFQLMHALLSRLLRVANMRPYIRHRRQHHGGGNFPLSMLVMLSRLTVVLDDVDAVLLEVLYPRDDTNGGSPKHPSLIAMDTIIR